MKKLFTDTRPLDKKAIDALFLSEEILMENAAAALESAVLSALSKTEETRPSVLIVTGSGGNGADGYTLGRRLALGERGLSVAVFEAKPPKTPLGIRQKERALACGVWLASSIESADVLVDCLFGSGFSGAIDDATRHLIEEMNGLADLSGRAAFKIACDVPSGLGASVCFRTDLTVCMGALKTALFTDGAADFTGEIETAPLGVSESLFASLGEEEAFLLEESDLRLPYRKTRNTHKGSFGHAAVFCGGKPGAAITAARAAFAFGSGLATLIPAGAGTDDALRRFAMPHELMLSCSVPKGVAAFAAGMGLNPAEEGDKSALESVAAIIAANPSVPAVIDADFFYYEGLILLLKERPAGLVLTPHPKEFASLLRVCRIADVTAEEASHKRFALVREFCSSFPGVVLVAKGAIPVIGLCPARRERAQLYANPLGTPALAKGGSGDVLAGLVCGLLAQGYAPVDAAISASLAHALASRKAATDWGLTPSSLIESAARLCVE